MTAHLGLFREAGLTAGQNVFVQGGAGGVGSMVVQMAKAVGARVMTTAGSDDKVQICRDLGADEAINYRTADVKAAAKSFAPDGIDVFWEIQRKPDLATTIEMMAPRGKIVIMAGGDDAVPLPIRAFFAKGLSLRGFVMFKATPDELRAAASDINTWLASGKLRPLIGQRLKLSDAAEAHRRQEAATIGGSGDLVGKIILTPDTN